MDCPEALLLSFHNVRLLQYENFVLQAKNAVNDVTDRFASYPGHSIGKNKKTNWPGNLSKFNLLTSTALEFALPIRFQNASRDSYRISIVS